MTVKKTEKEQIYQEAQKLADTPIDELRMRYFEVTEDNLESARHLTKGMSKGRLIANILYDMFGE